ncbi:hypothetical protein L6164_033369 [Bauhinia variegata]|uniref:Uncharacterized protein n=1 Tax=Bauhinia variegata TaxID=167791 RepID=A0ACB9KRH7_BAUVA|nr:hypothetical protein L6164_033369 [Bauhinia variegata]
MELFKQLVYANLMVPKLIQPQQPPYPHWYNSNITYDYHNGTVGHSIETCPTFKSGVLHLIHQGAITLQHEGRVPNINTNLQPNHIGEHKACGRLAKWEIVLFEYDVIYMTKKSIKGIAIADHLVDKQIEDCQPMKFEFLNEDNLVVDKEEEKAESNRWKMYFERINLEFERTNNVAEYEVCVQGLKAALDLKVKSLDVFKDSTIIIYQIKGEWQTRDPKLVPYQKFLTEFIEEFDDITFFSFDRDKNQ